MYNENNLSNTHRHAKPNYCILKFLQEVPLILAIETNETIDGGNFSQVIPKNKE